MAKQIQVETKLAPTTFREKVVHIGPGLVVAATSVGAPDLIASIVVGKSYGMTFLWAIVIGTLIKYYMNEGVGRWHLATGKTIIDGWQSLGSWATGYFSTYSIIWGFVYGATAAMTCGLAMSTMFPIFPIWGWAMIHSLAGFLLVFTGRYQFFEKVMTGLVILMFLTIIGTACFFLPTLNELAWGLVPRMPEGSLFLALGLLGGLGGTITMASYGYWIRENDWKGKAWVPMMRLDAKVGYIITGIFCAASLVIGAQFLFGTSVNIRGNEGFVTLAAMLGEQFGTPLRWIFLLAFWSAAFSSLLGVWNGVPYLFSDFIHTLQAKRSKSHQKKEVSEKDLSYRFYLFWLTFPPMLLFAFGKPVELIIIWGVIGSLFMPFMAITLLFLLNSRKVDKSVRNNPVANLVLGGSLILFVILGINELINLFG